MPQTCRTCRVMLPTLPPIPHTPPNRGASRISSAIGLLLGLAALLAAESFAWAQDEKPGARIYQEMCARCHGDRGQGTADTQNRPLIGDKSIGQLTQLIAKTMPEDDVGTCVGDDAANVAEYIHETFYSATARARFAQARLELAHLTVKQYRNAVADLVGEFRGDAPNGPRDGLHGEYYKTRNHKDENRLIDRTDPVVAFDFGEGSPLEGSIPSDDFSIRWRGSVFAPETGDYTFTIRSRNGAELFVNDNRKPLIDASVRSGTEPEVRESLFLIGGRSYPLRLEWFKSKEAKEKAASIALMWKTPGGVEEVIPQRFLSTAQGAPTLVAGTPFPPDDRSVGYERGSSVSRAWDQATTDAALEISGAVASQADRLAGVAADAPDRVERLKAFATSFAERAFRRPLEPEETEFYINRQFARDGGPDAALRRTVLLVLKSPRFLYVDLNPRDRSDFAIAERLAFGLWDSVPDKVLRHAAYEEKLAHPDELRQQAERMANDPRARAKLRDFLLQWLRVDAIPELSKDRTEFPEFTPELAADLRTSLDLFLNDLITSDQADLRRLFLANELYVNERLAQFLGSKVPQEAGFHKTAVDEEPRAGVMTHPYLLSMLAYSKSSSPIHRGVFLYRGVLGRGLRPPPVAVAPLAPELHADLTTRERVKLQTSPEACQICHAQINPLGFTLESFDAVGRFRTQEREQPIDSEGSYVDRSGERQSFPSARILGEFLATSPEVHNALIEQLFHHLVKQPIAAFEPGLLDELREGLVQHNFDIRHLMVDIMCRTAGRNDLPPEPAPPANTGGEHRDSAQAAPPSISETHNPKAGGTSS